jgi:uncharacterized repeat protein (TIGR03987 family)
MLNVAVMLMIVALVFYTVSVWAERFIGLKGTIVCMFVTGFTVDATGICMMATHVKINASAVEHVHVCIGIVAAVIIALHATWALAVYFRQNKSWEKLFRRYSVYAWGIWLLSLISGGLL